MKNLRFFLYFAFNGLLINLSSFHYFFTSILRGNYKMRESSVQCSFKPLLRVLIWDYLCEITKDFP